jgi:4-oxalmesaconate hydratase
MIIDCHGHYTTAPGKLQAYRDAQIAHFEDPSVPPAELVAVSDDEIRESIEENQLKALRARGADMTIFSPKASAMAHHIGDEAVSKKWTRINNDMIYRVTQLFPDNFIGVCQLPQSVGIPIDNSIEELRRCVTELGFVGCNLNPDPSGGRWTGPPLTDKAWYPFFEAMVELDVPAMIHVSGSCNPNLGFSGVAPDHSARRRRRAVSLGPLSRPGRYAEQARTDRAHHEERILRYLCLPSAGHRSAVSRDRYRQHSVRIGDVRCG